MKSKHLNKAKLIAVNNQAKIAGGNHIDPDFVALLPDRFVYLVCLALLYQIERGWVRCRAYALRFAQRGVSQQDFFEKSRVQRRG